MSKHAYSHYLPHERMKTFLTQNFATFPTTISRRVLRSPSHYWAVLKKIDILGPVFLSLSNWLVSQARLSLAGESGMRDYKLVTSTGINHVSVSIAIIAILISTRNTIQSTSYRA